MIHRTIDEKTTKQEIQIKSVSVNTVKEWKENPRKNDEAAVKLAELLKEHGQRSPIVVWKKNMVIYKGNTTFKAVKLLGWKTIDVILTDFPSEIAAIAYGIADNKSSEFSEWDDLILSDLLKADTDGYCVKERIGFTEKELKGLFNPKKPSGKEKVAKPHHEIDVLGDYIVLSFDSTEDVDRFREWMELTEGDKTLTFKKMVEIMQINW